MEASQEVRVVVNEGNTKYIAVGFPTKNGNQGL